GTVFLELLRSQPCKIPWKKASGNFPGTPPNCGRHSPGPGQTRVSLLMITGVTVLGSVDENARRRFEADWQAGRPKPLEDYLPGADHCDYLATLVELVHIELEFVWKSWQPAGTDRTTKQTGASASPVCQPALVETYLARFPCLNQPSVVLRLLE